MPLAANSKLGPYEIKSTLGVGGMGEVYRAWDSRLNRDVAIKVLRQDSAPGSTGASADLRSRFEREARAVAALNHPNIIGVYDFGIESGQQYIVSELLEGESLRALLKGKPLPVRKLIETAAQIADGLSAAHAAGIVHRDLKPENIMLTKDGRAKILDFGLARHASTISPGSDETFAPNTHNLTSAGAILGTAAYMSPEQALGQETDYRSDQFSLGLILYEMASGKQAFAKPNSIETMAAIVRDEPPPIEEKLAPPLKWTIDRCLAKDPEQRYQSTRDLYGDLRNLRDHFSEAYTSGAFPTTPVAKFKPRRWMNPTIFAACAVFAATFAYLFRPLGQDITKYRYTPFASDASDPVWSPDGKAIAYSRIVDGTPQVFLRYLGLPAAIQLTHGDHAAWPKGWSADRAHLIVLVDAFNDGKALQKLYSMPIVGGDPEFIMNAECHLACDLSRDGNTYAEYSRAADGIYRIGVSAPLGSPLQPYTSGQFTSREIYGLPRLGFSPNGKKMLLVREDEKKQDALLFAYPYAGAPRSILGGLIDVYGNPTFSWMPDERSLIVSFGVGRGAIYHLWLADTESKSYTQMTTGTTDETLPTVSPDGKTVIYTQDHNQSDVITLSLKDGSASTFISSGRIDIAPDWSTKQGKITWLTNRGGAFEIWMRSPDGSERPVVTEADFPSISGDFLTPSLSPDGERLIFSRAEETGFRLWITSLAGGSPLRLTNDQQSMEYGGSWSPDGSRFVYTRSQSGKYSLLIAKTNGNAAPVLLKKDIQDYLSDWSPTGEWITYRDATGWNLISPDGKESKFIGNFNSYYLAFSNSGKLLYGIEMGQTQSDKHRVTVFSLNPVTLKQTVIKELGEELRPSDQMWPNTRFRLGPDGEHFVYSVARNRHDLWMLTGYRQPGIWSRLCSVFAR